ncbi:hypothetical protein RF11_13781 [Thelohanellus kitauei]|uniref:Uncharacterized protein n=1 Tax=Thelohanellus kitauei TaxID=669202 RepID=A0A0C2JIV5_THEKT|nr:hypothetical protein RF11_13781 [Thelohanellus kitauei]
MKMLRTPKLRNYDGEIIDLTQFKIPPFSIKYTLSQEISEDSTKKYTPIFYDKILFEECEEREKWCKDASINRTLMSKQKLNHSDLRFMDKVNLPDIYDTKNHDFFKQEHKKQTTPTLVTPKNKSPGETTPGESFKYLAPQITTNKTAEKKPINSNQNKNPHLPLDVKRSIPLSHRTTPFHNGPALSRPHNSALTASYT